MRAAAEDLDLGQRQAHGRRPLGKMAPQRQARAPRPRHAPRPSRRRSSHCRRAAPCSACRRARSAVSSTGFLILRIQAVSAVAISVSTAGDAPAHVIAAEARRRRRAQVERLARSRSRRRPARWPGPWRRRRARPRPRPSAGRANPRPAGRARRRSSSRVNAPAPPPRRPCTCAKRRAAAAPAARAPPCRTTLPLRLLGQVLDRRLAVDPGEQQPGSSDAARASRSATGSQPTPVEIARRPAHRTQPRKSRGAAGRPETLEQQMVETEGEVEGRIAVPGAFGVEEDRPDPARSGCSSG